MEPDKYQDFLAGFPSTAESPAACSSGCCCGTKSSVNLNAPYITGTVQSGAGIVPKIATALKPRDYFGAWKVRWGIGRMSYRVEPGLYAVGSPNGNSPVLVSANYKLTFDSLRKELAGLHVWLLILDTKGVNVWCAAGKGTFGTKELLKRIDAVSLSKVVTHRTLILPQLGATGVAAHEIAKESGFHVVYGPVRACDIKAFLAAEMKATPQMREVKFTIADRIVLTPVDLVQSFKPFFLFLGVLFLLNAVGIGKFGFMEFAGFFGAIAAGCVFTPILLPWIPGRAFAFKGALLGVIWAIAVIFLFGGFGAIGLLKTISFFLLLPSVSAYMAMNFTGSSTFTSPTGVNKEMRIAIPVMILASVLGIVLLLADSIIKMLQ